MAWARTRGFTLVELVVGCAVVALVCVVAAPGLTQARKNAGLAGSLANLKKIGETTGAYAADFEDHFWTFSWRAGDAFSQWDDLNGASSDIQAAANQAVDILRRRFDDSVTPISNWIPHISTSTLVLADYLGEPLPAEWSASPGDAALLEWQADPYALGSTWIERRRAFWSSYQLPTAFVSPDEPPTITQASAHNLYLIEGNLTLGGRRTPEVVHPSRKVHLAESASWFYGPRPVFYLHQTARVPVLMADGAASPRTTADANSGWNPRNPFSVDSMFTYSPAPWEPEAVDPSGTDTIFGRHRWTRRGLRGVDFAGERAE